MSASAIDGASSVIQSFLQFALTKSTGQSQTIGGSNTAPALTDSVSFSTQALQLQTGAVQGVSGTDGDGDHDGSGTAAAGNPSGTQSVDTTSSSGVARPHNHHHHHHGGSGQSNSGSFIAQLAKSIASDLQSATSGSSQTNQTGAGGASTTTGTTHTSFVQRLADSITNDLLAAVEQGAASSTPGVDAQSSQAVTGIQVGQTGTGNTSVNSEVNLDRLLQQLASGITNDLLAAVGQGTQANSTGDHGQSTTTTTQSPSPFNQIA